MSKVVTVHGHTLELDMGPSCPNPGIGEFDLRATYGVGFVESLPDIANGEMTEIRIKYTTEKCE